MFNFKSWETLSPLRLLNLVVCSGNGIDEISCNEEIVSGESYTHRTYSKQV